MGCGVWGVGWGVGGLAQRNGKSDKMGENGSTKTVLPSCSGRSSQLHGWKNVASGHITPLTLAFVRDGMSEHTLIASLQSKASLSGAVGHTPRFTLHSDAASQVPGGPGSMYSAELCEPSISKVLIASSTLTDVLA